MRKDIAQYSSFTGAVQSEQGQTSGLLQ